MEHETEIGIFIGFGIMAMFSLAMLLILFSLGYSRKLLEKENKIQAMQQEKQVELLKTSVEAEEKQKELLANNLHDGTIPQLTIIGRNLDHYIDNFNPATFNPEDLRKEVAAIEQTVEDIRAIAYNLIPKILFSMGLVKAIGYYIDQTNHTQKSFADFENKAVFENDIPFSKNDQLNIYRACLEILNNLYKHAHYTYLKVTLESIDNMLVIEFTHDGKSTTNEEIELYTESTIGLGLKSIRARLVILNGIIVYSTDSELAFIKLSIPFNP